MHAVHTVRPGTGGGHLGSGPTPDLLGSSWLENDFHARIQYAKKYARGIHMSVPEYHRDGKKIHVVYDAAVVRFRWFGCV